MLVKIVTFFLIFMAVLAMFGRLRWPGRMGGKLGKPREREKIDKPRRPGRCPNCGAFRIGRGPCPCGQED